MSVYQMGKLRIIDLSKSLDPATETRRCNLFRFNTGRRIPDYHTHMDLMSHLGTPLPYGHTQLTELRNFHPESTLLKRR